jgi:hypothetical protein
MEQAEQSAGGVLVNVLAYQADYLAATEELKLLETAASISAALSASKFSGSWSDTVVIRQLKSQTR